MEGQHFTQALALYTEAINSTTAPSASARPPVGAPPRLTSRLSHSGAVQPLQQALAPVRADGRGRPGHGGHGARHRAQPSHGAARAAARGSGGDACGGGAAHCAGDRAVVSCTATRVFMETRVFLSFRVCMRAFERPNLLDKTTAGPSRSPAQTDPRTAQTPAWPRLAPQPRQRALAA